MKKNIVPIAFAFDNNLVIPACICISSLLMNARPDTFYDIFILHPENEALDIAELDKIPFWFANCRLNYRKVGNIFDHAFQTRGINTVAYFRLLIPRLVPEYDVVLYSDVDVIFQDDLADLYRRTDLTGYYLAGVNSLSYLNRNLERYYHALKVAPDKIIYSGNLIIHSKAILEDGIINHFIRHATRRYVFQDMDIINIVCADKIKYLPPSYCVTTYFTEFAAYHKDVLLSIWSEDEIKQALEKGIIHYNGQKPWKGYCINFDIWWEYYRKSPFFDEKFYFKFFYDKLNVLDQLSLWKRIKILARYFLHGRMKEMKG